MNIRKKNSARKYKDGTKWLYNGIHVEIIGQLEDCYGKNYMYATRDENGNIYKLKVSDLVKENKDDCYTRTVVGVGYVGEGDAERSFKKNGKYYDTREYTLWRNMIRRVHIKTKDITYNDVKIADEWYCFNTFCKDIKTLEGYSIWKDGNNYQLDKDIKSDKNNKIYSVDTCMFVSPQLNAVKASTKGNGIRTLIGKNEESSIVVKFWNITQFAKEYGLSRGGIDRCINRGQKSYKGWTFSIA